MQLQMPFQPDSLNWLESMRGAGMKASTLDCYARDLRDVAAALGTSDVRDLPATNQESVDRMEAAWMTGGAGSATVSRRFSALRVFARHLSSVGERDLSKLLSAKFPAAARGQRPQVDDETIEMLGAAFVADEETPWVALRDQAAVLLAASSGLTTAELIGLDQEHFLADRALVSVTFSHLQQRLAAVSEEARDAVLTYVEALPFPVPPDGPLFVTARNTRMSPRTLQLAFRKRRRAAGIPDCVVPSALRHFRGNRLAASGASLEIVAGALGLKVLSAARYFQPAGPREKPTNLAGAIRNDSQKFGHTAPFLIRKTQ